jgi:pimeloyl-ACP methyl ester carboxylesterase
VKNVYVLSGLGADQRVFQHIDFGDLSPTFVQWIPPRTHETIQQYARRLLEQIPTPKPTLIGVSFGGMIAVEIAKLIDTDKVILLSSAKTKADLPFYYRWAGALQLHRLLPTALLKQANGLTNWLFGVHSPADKQLLSQILRDTDGVFLRWAIDQIARWQNQVVPPNLIHIHGTTDKILPYCQAHSHVSVAGGGHLMVLNKAQEVSALLHQAY